LRLAAAIYAFVRMNPAENRAGTPHRVFFYGDNFHTGNFQKASPPMMII